METELNRALIEIIRKKNQRPNLYHLVQMKIRILAQLCAAEKTDKKFRLFPESIHKDSISLLTS